MKLYHATNKENLASILENGLLKSYSTLWKGAGGVVYLATTPVDARNFGEIILEVDITLEDECYSLSDWEHNCWNDIPPNRIRVLNVGYGDEQQCR